MINILDIQRQVSKKLEYESEKEEGVKPSQAVYLDQYGRPWEKRYPMSPKHKKRLARQKKRKEQLKRDLILVSSGGGRN